MSFEAVTEFLRDKTVSLVGNAWRLFEQDLGGRIDASDVVIRLNSGFPMQKQQGARTDILACGVAKLYPEQLHKFPGVQFAAFVGRQGPGSGGGRGQ